MDWLYGADSSGWLERAVILMLLAVVFICLTVITHQKYVEQFVDIVLFFVPRRDLIDMVFMHIAIIFAISAGLSIVLAIIEFLVRLVRTL